MAFPTEPRINTKITLRMILVNQEIQISTVHMDKKKVIIIIMLTRKTYGTVLTYGKIVEQ